MSSSPMVARTAPIAGQEAHCRGKPTPSALPRNDDLCRVNAEVVRVSAVHCNPQ